MSLGRAAAREVVGTALLLAVVVGAVGSFIGAHITSLYVPGKRLKQMFGLLIVVDAPATPLCALRSRGRRSLRVYWHPVTAEDIDTVEKMGDSLSLKTPDRSARMVTGDKEFELL